jgi:hypothetical protein
MKVMTGNQKEMYSIFYLFIFFIRITNKGSKMALVEEVYAHWVPHMMPGTKRQGK